MERSIIYLMLLTFIGISPGIGQFLKGDRYASVGFNSGLATYQGDLTAKNQYFATSTMGMSLGAEISRKLGDITRVRGNFTWSRIRGNYQPTQLSFRNDIFELSGILQLDFLHLRGHYSERPRINPYFFLGAGAIYHSPQGLSPQQYGNVWVSLQSLGTEGQGRGGFPDKYSLLQTVIPMGIGMNFRLTERLELGIETGFRHTFTDYLDDVGGKYAEPSVFGNDELAKHMANPAGVTQTTKRTTNDVNDSYLITNVHLRYIFSKNMNPNKLARIYSINRPIDNIVVSDRFSRYEDRYKVSPMRSINTEYDEMCPTFHRNGILFVSDRHIHHDRSARGNGRLYNIFYSPSTHYKRDEITKPVHLNDKQFKGKHLFAPSSSVHAPNVVFVMYNDRDNTHRVPAQQIFVAEPQGEYVWGKIASLPYNSDCYSVTHPSLSEDGTMLYFVSDMSGGLGGTDIYVSRFIDGQWSLPENLGQPVNTSGNEMFPFIHQDGSLYFASDGHAGMGGLDIFEAVPDRELGRFVRVGNVGSPINSPYDDFALVLDEVKRVGYFTSDRLDPSEDDHLHGRNDIYEVKVEKLNISRLLTDDSDSLLLVHDVHVSGAVINKITGNPVPRAVIKIRNVINEEIQSLRTDDEGIFYANLFSDGLYEIGCSSIGFENFKPMSISTMGKSDSTLEVKLFLEPAKYKFTIKGQIRDEQENVPLANVMITVLDLEKEKQYQLQSNADGEYIIELENEKNYTIYISEKGYVDKSFHISTYNKKASQTVVLNMMLKPAQ